MFRVKRIPAPSPCHPVEKRDQGEGWGEVSADRSLPVASRAIAIGVIVLGATATAFAQQNATGMKPEVLGAPSTDKAPPLFDATALIQLCVALGIVYVLIRYVFPRLMSKLGGKVNTGIGGTIKTCETASCGTSTLQVLEVRGKTLLVSVNPTGVSLITDLTDATEAQAKDDKTAFFELLDARRQEPLEMLATKAVVDDSRRDPHPSPLLGKERGSEPKPDNFEESLRLLTEAKAKMAARTSETIVKEDADNRSDQLRRLIG